MKKRKIAITLSDDDFSKLEELRMHDFRRSKSREISWLIREEWKRFQEEIRKESPAEIAKGIKRLEIKAADYVAPRGDTRVIQFPLRQFSGSA